MDRSAVLLSVVVLAVVASCAAEQPTGLTYWSKVLPNTPVPSGIRDLLAPTDAYSEDKSGTAVHVGKGGVSVNTGKPKPGGTSVNVGHGGVGVNTGNPKPGGTSVNVGHGGVHVNTGNGKPGGTHVNVGHGGVSVGVNHPGIRTSGFDYKYAASETQVHDDPTVALFFLEKDLRPGKKMTMRFTPTTTGAAFVSRQAADSVPFSSGKISTILDHYGVDPSSDEATAMKQTVAECEAPAMVGESKLCATSLESMVDFSTASLGTRNVRADSTAVSGEGTSSKQRYTIVSSGVRRLGGSSKLVVCHSQEYAHAVFYCHATRKTRAYEVVMAGEDGESRVDAVAVCHVDTAGWNPKHVAFQVLGVAPGTVPVCHFLPQDHVVWSTKQ